MMGSIRFTLGDLDEICTKWLWVNNRVTPKWVALVSGNMDQNLRSNSWWFNFDPRPNQVNQWATEFSGLLSTPE